MKKSVLVINYHRIIPENSADASIDNVFSVSNNDFETQLNCLCQHNIPVVSLNDIINNTMSHDFSVAITCDDGNDSDGEIVYPALKAKGFTATFFWLSDRMNPSNLGLAEKMIEDGFHIGSHSISHANLVKLSHEEQNGELRSSKKALAQIAGQSVSYFAFPYGIYNRGLLALVKEAGYTAACTTRVKLNYPEESPFLIHRWSVKQNTSLKEFEGMITCQSVFQRKQAASKIKNAAQWLLGKSIADHANRILNS